MPVTGLEALMQLEKYLTIAQQLDGGTIVILTLMATVAAVKVRSQMANVALMALVYPLMLLFSVAGFVIFSANDLFNPKKMADWLIYTVAAGSIGTSVTILLMAGFSRLWERSSPQ
jgi:hypothetical protein